MTSLEEPTRVERLRDNLVEVSINKDFSDDDGRSNYLFYFTDIEAKELAIKLLKVTGYKDGGICFGESAKHLKELMAEGEANDK